MKGKEIAQLWWNSQTYKLAAWDPLTLYWHDPTKNASTVPAIIEKAPSKRTTFNTRLCVDKIYCIRNTTFWQEANVLYFVQSSCLPILQLQQLSCEVVRGILRKDESGKTTLAIYIYPVSIYRTITCEKNVNMDNQLKIQQII